VRASAGAVVRVTDAAVTDNTTNGMLAEASGVIAPFTENQVAGNPPGASGDPTCQLGTTPPAVACPSTNVCEAPVCQAPIIQSVVGPCKRCKTHGSVTTCSSCGVTVQ